jgi:hypothetical protein
MIFTLYPLKNKASACPRKKRKTSTVECGLREERGGFPLLLVIRYIEVNLYFVPKEIHRIFDRKKAAGAYIL